MPTLHPGTQQEDLYLYDSMYNRGDGEVSCSSGSRAFFKALYGIDFLAMSWTPFTEGQVHITEQIFDIRTVPSVDCLFWSLEGYNEEKTKVINSVLQTSSSTTMNKYKTSSSLSVKAALAVAFSEISASVEASHETARESANTTTQKNTFYMRTVESVDLKARISKHRPPLTGVFTEKVQAIFSLSRAGSPAYKSLINDLIQTYPFYVKELWAGSSFTQVCILFLVLCLIEFWFRTWNQTFFKNKSKSLCNVYLAIACVLLRS